MERKAIFIQSLSTPEDIATLSRILSEMQIDIEDGNVLSIKFTGREEPDTRTIAEGYVYFDSTTKRLRAWDGTTWNDLW